jgi:hypothetical protein
MLLGAAAAAGVGVAAALAAGAAVEEQGVVLQLPAAGLGEWVGPSEAVVVAEASAPHPTTQTDTIWSAKIIPLNLRLWGTHACTFWVFVGAI